MPNEKDRELLISLIKFCRGVRVGKDLELAEAALRRERQLQAELDRMPALKPSEHPGHLKAS